MTGPFRTCRVVLGALTAAMVLHVSLVSPAHAIERLRADLTSCAAIQQTLLREGRVILRYPSTRVANYILYSHYVSGTAFCRHGEIAVRRSVRAADTPHCPVFKCEEFEPLFDHWWRWR